MCGVRSGDKGDTSDLSLFADDEPAYRAIRDEVTADRVKAHFAGLVNGPVERYEASNVWALKFVMHEALGGGAPRSLRSDNLGKTHGASLLRMWIEVPDDVAANARRRDRPPRA
ncbi:MAG: AtuA-related protein [Acidimicrobiales bacterium]